MFFLFFRISAVFRGNSSFSMIVPKPKTCKNDSHLALMSVFKKKRFFLRKLLRLVTGERYLIKSAGYRFLIPLF